MSEKKEPTNDTAAKLHLHTSRNGGAAVRQIHIDQAQVHAALYVGDQIGALARAITLGVSEYLRYQRGRTR